MKNILPSALLALAFGAVSCNPYKQVVEKGTDFTKFDYISTAVTQNNDTLWTVVTDKPLGHNACDRVTACSVATIDKFTRQEVGAAGAVTVYTEEVPEQLPTSDVKYDPLRTDYKVKVFSSEGALIKEVTTRFKPNLWRKGFAGNPTGTVLKDVNTGEKYKAPATAAVSYKANR